MRWPGDRSRRMTAMLAERKGADLGRALAQMHALAEECSDSRTFVDRALADLPALVASDLTTLSVCDLRGGTRRVFGRLGEALTEADRSAFDRHFHEHPLVRF